MTETKRITYTSTKDFDFTKLDNYVPPEETMEDHNETWAAKKSGFYSLRYESFINREACKRAHPDEIEIRAEPGSLSDEQLDALRSWTSPYGEPTAEETAIVEAMGITHWFRYNTIITPHGMFGLAVVRDNKLVFAYAC